MEIGTSIKVPATPFMVQPIAITKPISPQKGGTCLEIIPLHVQVANVANEPMRSSESFDKEHVNPSFIVLDNNSRILGIFIY
jgi:hypothetical protein